jgi:kynurenine formamidase
MEQSPIQKGVVIAGRRYTVIDVSTPISNDTSTFEVNPHHIEYLDHRQGVTEARRAAGIDPEIWPNGRAWAVENVSLSTHAGTHVDAPYHYGPDGPNGPARTIDQVPLAWCIGPGVMLDMTAKGVGDGITDADCQAALDTIECELQGGEIILIHTDTSRRYREPGYHLQQPGLRRSATEWLVSQGVRMIGIDAWGLDRPLDLMVREARDGDVDQLWESHFFGTEVEYLQIEKLSNLDLLPRPTGFTVFALPILLEGASAGWTRTIAIFDEGKDPA